MTEIEILGSLQTKIMNFLWKNGPSLVRDVLNKINEGVDNQDQLAYTTVLTVARNLVKKNYLASSKDSGLAHTFTPVITRDEYLKGITKTIRNDLFESKDEFLSYISGLDN